MDTNKNKVPLKKELYEFSLSDMSDLKLVGSECKNCGERHFSEKPICPNCSSRHLEKIFLSDTGTIETYTTVRQASPAWQGAVPYTIVEAKLDDGVKITTHLVENNPDKVEIGSRVKIVPGKLREDEQGNDIMVHMFKIIE